MASRILTLLSIVLATLSSLTTALPALPHLEAKGVTDTRQSSFVAHLQPLPTLSTFSEISPVWSSGFPVTLGSLAASAGFGNTGVPQVTVTMTRTDFSRGSSTTSVTETISLTAAPSTTTESIAFSLRLTTVMSTITDTIVPSNMTSTPALVVPTSTTLGAVVTATSKAVAPTLVVGLGSLLSVALGVVAVL